jgi:hypothetical protein
MARWARSGNQATSMRWLAYGVTRCKPSDQPTVARLTQSPSTSEGTPRLHHITIGSSKRSLRIYVAAIVISLLRILPTHCSSQRARRVIEIAITLPQEFWVFRGPRNRPSSIRLPGASAHASDHTAFKTAVHSLVCHVLIVASGIC